MRKIYLDKLIYTRVFLVSMAIGILNAISAITRGDVTGTEILLKSFYSVLFIENIPSSIRVVVFPLLITTLLSSCVSEDYKIITYYGFHRNGGRIGWLKKQYFKIFLYILSASFIYGIANFIIQFFIYDKFEISKELCIILIENIVLLAMFLFFATLLSIVISLLISPKWVIIINAVWILFFAGLVKYTEHSFFYYLNPITNFMQSYHEGLLPMLGNEHNTVLQFEYSLTYFTLLTVVFAVVGCIIIKKIEPGIKVQRSD